MLPKATKRPLSSRTGQSQTELAGTWFPKSPLTKVEMPLATRPARAYSFQAPKDNGITGADTETASIPFVVANVVSGTYLAYISVDGADSPLGLAGGAFDSPKVTVTAQHEQNPKQPRTDGQWHPEEWQAEVHEAAWTAMKERPFVWGTFVWCMFDFAVSSRHEGGVWPLGLRVRCPAAVCCHRTRHRGGLAL